ncbi:MAG: hypothetical protein ACPGEG_08580 [Salibacteraceae bacterium]
MKTISIFISAILLAYLFSACEKDNEQILTKTSVESIADFFKDNRVNNTQIFTEDNNKIVRITGEQGTSIIFSPNSFETKNGDPVTGEIEIKLLEVYTKGDMILNDLPTVGRKKNGELAPLISGGQFNIQVSQNQEELKLVKTAFVSTKDQELDDNMGIFEGEELNGQVTWIESTNNSIENCDTGIVKIGQYCLNLNFLNWINCDFFNNDPRPKTQIAIELPSDFNSTNTHVYITFQNQSSILKLHGEENIFRIPSGYNGLPIGLVTNIHCIANGKNGIEYAAINTTIEKDHLEVIKNTQFETLTLAKAIEKLKLIQ